MKKITKYLQVEGLVQGVGYRASLSAIALKYKVNGWVRNLPDGNVEAIIQADEKLIEKLILWCKKGPSKANVTKVVVTDLSDSELYTEYEKFEIKY